VTYIRKSRCAQRPQYEPAHICSLYSRLKQIAVGQQEGQSMNRPASIDAALPQSVQFQDRALR